MKKIIWIFMIVLGILAACFFYSSPISPVREVTEPSSISGGNESQIKDGDVIFQTSQSSQSKAIQLATKSKYSHCGIVYKDGNEFYVYEAVQPVKSTPLNKWIARGESGKYIVKRLKNADDILTPAVLKKMKQEGEKFKGK
ncbi:MAG: YiiX/YebB-like N1pC/P60 family cysteine hydrolase, partial [Sphingomonadales bacterium]